MMNRIKKLFDNMFINKTRRTIVTTVIAIASTITLITSNSPLVVIAAAIVLIADAFYVAFKGDIHAMNNVSFVANTGSFISNMRIIFTSLKEGKNFDAAIAALNSIFNIFRHTQIMDSMDQANGMA